MLLLPFCAVFAWAGENFVFLLKRPIGNHVFCALLKIMDAIKAVSFVIHTWDAVSGLERGIGRTESIRRYFVVPNLPPDCVQERWPSVTGLQLGTALYQSGETYFVIGDVQHVQLSGLFSDL